MIVSVSNFVLMSSNRKYESLAICLSQISKQLYALLLNQNIRKHEPRV